LKAASTAKASAEVEPAPIQQGIREFFEKQVPPALPKAAEEGKQRISKEAGQGPRSGGRRASRGDPRERSRQRSRPRDRHARRSRSRSRDKRQPSPSLEGGRHQRPRPERGADGGRDEEFDVNEAEEAADDKRGPGPPPKSGDTDMAPAPVPATKRKDVTIPTKDMSPKKMPATKKQAVPSHSAN
jgi:hypothetical protein